MTFYNKITQDLTSIVDAIDYFDSELIKARNECKITGQIEKAVAMLPGIIEYRFNQLQEIEAILEYLNIELRKIRSSNFRKYLETYQRALSSRDCEKFVDGEPEVINHEKIINQFALLRNKWLGVIKAMDQKAYALNNIVKLRCAGLDDASL